MNKKPLVYRTCVVTREKLLKDDLFRVVVVNNKVVVDSKHSLGGRGVYMKKDLSTIKKGQEKHSLSRALKREVDDSIYLELIQELAKERR